MMKNSKAREVSLVGIMIAVIVASKIALASLPNIELVSFLIIVFTKKFDRKVLFVIPAYILLEALIFSFQLMWFLASLYMWFLLYILVRLFGKTESPLSLAVLSGLYGLFFGFLSSFPYLFVTTSFNPTAGVKSAIAWWIAGIPFDVLHAVGNFAIMLVLYLPVKRIFDSVTKK